MTPKILLVNFTQRDADLVEKSTGLKVLRGYLSEVDTVTAERDGTQTPNIKFYSPEAYYECMMVFISLPRSSDLKEEFDKLARELTKEDLWSRISYWKSRGQVLVVFVGKTNIDSLWPLGIPQRLTPSSGNDTRTKLQIDEDHELYDLIKVVDQQIKMPTDNYVLSGLKPKEDQYSPDPYYSFGTHWNAYITNANGDYLMTSLSKDTSDYRGEEPGVLIVPAPKKLARVTTKITEFFGNYYDVYTTGGDWRANDKFYPQATLRKLTKEISDIRSKAEEDASQKQSLIDAHKQEWAFLGNLVTEQGDVLVDAVHKVLSDVIGLKVTKSDDTVKGEPIEDLVVELDGRLISIEVKGTTKPNAPLEYTQQPFQHITRRGHGGEVEAGLILNHDMSKDPQYRKAAYTDKDKVALIANLYFIDTRTLLDVAIAVIDEKLSQEEATSILFGAKGRVEYDPSSLKN